MTWKERMSRIIALGMYDRMTTPKLPNNVEHYVAAGNPGKTFSEYPVSLQIPVSFVMGKMECHRQDYTLYTVSGNSMLPDGIRNGFELLTYPATEDDVRLGDFIVIEVDSDYFQVRHRGRKSHFVHKLRRALCVVDDGMTAEQICITLNGTFAEPLDDKEKADLRESLDEAREFYHNTRLFLSVTYHNGGIHYSFHPSCSIRYRVDGVAYLDGNNICYKPTSELAN